MAGNSFENGLMIDRAEAYLLYLTRVLSVLTVVRTAKN
jgi:hypothetical protein